MRAAVHSVLQGLQLQQPVSSDMAMGLLSDIHHGALPCCSTGEMYVITQCGYANSTPDRLTTADAEFETAAAAGGWQPFLLPGSDEAASPQVSAMLAEVRHMVDTAAFNTALRVRQTLTFLCRKRLQLPSSS
jgi:hypothetical protein